jgi:quinol monooxygenase YgiN
VSKILGIARFRFHEGKAEEFKRLSAQAMDIVRAKERGRTLEYDVYFNADETECVVIERYTDSNALIEHFANMGELMEPILSMVEVVHGEVLGEPNEELRGRLAGGKVPELFTPWMSMTDSAEDRLG